MIDHLHEVLSYLEDLPPEAQEEVAAYIESLAEALKHESRAPERIQRVPHEIPFGREMGGSCGSVA